MKFKAVLPISNGEIKLPIVIGRGYKDIVRLCHYDGKYIIFNHKGKEIKVLTDYVACDDSPDGLIVTVSMDNVRMWTWHNDYVKLTIPTDGKEVVITDGGNHEEGYQTNVAVYHFETDEAKLISTMEQYGRDCDGPYESHAVYECGLNQLKNLQLEQDGPPIPNWSRRKAWQRDVYAEQMNY